MLLLCNADHLILSYYFLKKLMFFSKTLFLEPSNFFSDLNYLFPLSFHLFYS